MPPLPADVDGATRQHLDTADSAAPGLIRALYLTVSVALGDYQPWTEAKFHRAPRKSGRTRIGMSARWQPALDTASSASSAWNAGKPAPRRPPPYRRIPHVGTIGPSQRVTVMAVNG